MLLKQIKTIVIGLGLLISMVLPSGSAYAEDVIGNCSITIDANKHILFTIYN